MTYDEMKTRTLYFINYGGGSSTYVFVLDKNEENFRYLTYFKGWDLKKSPAIIWDDPGYHYQILKKVDYNVFDKNLIKSLFERDLF